MAGVHRAAPRHTGAGSQAHRGRHPGTPGGTQVHRGQAHRAGTQGRARLVADNKLTTQPSPAAAAATAASPKRRAPADCGDAPAKRCLASEVGEADEGDPPGLLHTLASGMQLWDFKDMPRADKQNVRVQGLRPAKHPHALVRHGDQVFGLYQGYVRECAFLVIPGDDGALYGKRPEDLEEDEVTPLAAPQQGPTIVDEDPTSDGTGDRFKVVTSSGVRTFAVVDPLPPSPLLRVMGPLPSLPTGESATASSRPEMRLAVPTLRGPSRAAAGSWTTWT